MWESYRPDDERGTTNYERGSTGARIEHDFTGNKNPFMGEDEDITPELTFTTKQAFVGGFIAGFMVGMLALFIVLSVVARA